VKGRDRIHEVIFGHETPTGKAFDVVLIVAILASVIIVMLDSVQSIALRHRVLFQSAEWVFTGLFTIEYAARLYSAKSRMRYARSFFGVVDLLAILPTYLAIVVPASRYFIIVRVFRVLRVFRVRSSRPTWARRRSSAGRCVRAGTRSRCSC
jgi:voltage-gated potassium channel